MPASLDHQERMLLHCEATQKQAVERAKAIFEIVNLLALSRPFVTDLYLKRRISDALLNSHIAFNGEFFVDVDQDAVAILAERRTSA